jgi:hypothetical protein
MMVIASVRLSEKDVEFFSIGPPQPLSEFVIAPGGEKGYALYSAPQTSEYEFWEFDLVDKRVARRVRFEGRARMGLEASADGTKLYVHVAGNTIDVYDTETLTYQHTVEFDEDMTLGNMAIIPGDA